MPFPTDKLRVKPNDKVALATIDTRATPGWDADDKSGGIDHTASLNGRLEALQELLYAEGKHRVLVVLQAMDAAGKDGTIKHVFDGVNPSGVKVASFKKPSALELSHDYLWRIHAHTPANGELVIFNRSHYEDVLVVRVLGLIDDDHAKKRFEHIRGFEQMLADEGTTIVKIFLHISPEEQKERLQARLDEADKNWKFDPADLDARAHWHEYQSAFEEAMSATSTEQAPWYIIPADRKWYRNLAISEILLDVLEGLTMSFPTPADGLDQITIDDVSRAFGV
ncbi:MAG: polyphosphate kinase 2 family protein [Acidimicrobiales bacterium]